MTGGPPVPVPRAACAQEPIWLMEQMGGDASPYHMPVSLALEGCLNVDALCAAFGALVARHPLLASVIRPQDGELVIVPAARAPVIEVEDLTSIAEEEHGPLLARLTEEEVRYPFDLDAGPLLRARLFVRNNRSFLLLIVAHHLVFDGGSKDVLVRDLILLYRALAGRSQPGLPPIEASYEALAAAERALIARTRGGARRFWQQRWHRPEKVILPGGQRPGGRWAVAGEAFDFVFDASFCTRLDEAAARLSATRFQLLLAALHCLLVRYGNDETVVATDFSTRPPRARDVIGVFVNELPVFASLPADLTFREAAGKVAASLHDVGQHRAVPLAEALGGEAARQRIPVSVSYRRRVTSLPSLPGLRLTADWTMFASHVRRELHLQLVDSGREVAASLRYDRRALTSESAARIAAHYAELVGAAITNPDRRMGHLPVLSARERRQVLTGLNQAGAPLRYDTTLDVLLERQAAKTPDAIAAVFEHREMTYADLHRRASHLAGRLRRAGVGPEVMVAVYAERSLELVVGLLAVLMAGGVYLPLEPGYPAERLTFVLEDAAPRVLLTHGHVSFRLRRCDILTMLFDDETPLAPGGAPPRGRVCPDSAAYVIYTSGSTGNPKGAVNTHRAVCNRLEWMQKRYRLGPDDAVLQKTPIGFDVSVWELLWPLLAGARLVLARPGGHRDPAYLRRVIAGQAITTVHFVPSMLAIFLAGDNAEACHTLRRTICSGEELPVTVARRFFECLPGELHNLYGPTEAAIDVSAWDCRPAAIANLDRVPIGSAIQNTSLYVLDPRLDPAPIGVPGELHIGGVALARGYLNRPGLTAERFIPDPFGPAGSRMYKTGDLARLRSDGAVEFLGRLDSQVKIAGVRAELGEIESALRRQSGVVDAAVAVREDAAGDIRLVAFVVRQANGGTGAGELRSGLRHLLPAQLIPAAFVDIPSLPLTPNGKLDRDALPVAAPRATRGPDSAPPRTRGERLVAAIWTQVLRVDGISIDDDFFDAGGSSLLAARVIARLSATLRCDLALRLLFDHPTIRGLARALKEVTSAAGPAVAAPAAEAATCWPMPTRERGAWTGGNRRTAAGPEEAPASFFQEEYWQREQHGVPTHAGVSLAYRLRGSLDVGALERGLTEIVRRHEVLRTTFTQRGADVIQHIWPMAPFELARVELCGMPAAERARAGDRELIATIEAPFDLSRGPVLRAKLIRLSYAEHIFLLSAHHIVADDWSMGVLLTELATLYAAFRQGKPSPLSPLPLRYRDFVSWHRSRVERTLAANLRYWTQQLSDLPPPLRLSGGRDRSRIKSYRRARHVLPLRGNVPRKLSRASHGATTFLCVLAAFNMCLAGVTGSDDIVIASLFSGRDRPGFEPLAGLFPSLTVLRTSLAGDPAFGEVLRRVRDGALTAHQHKDFPFRRFARELGLGAPSGPRLPIWDVWANATRSRRGTLGILHDFRLDEIAVTGYSPGLARTQEKGEDVWEGDNLTLTLAGEADDPQLVIDYNAHLFTGEHADCFSGNLISTLERVARDPGTSLSSVRRLCAQEPA